MSRPVRPIALVILTICMVYPGVTLLWQGLYPFVAGDYFNLVGQAGPWMDLARSLHIAPIVVLGLKSAIGAAWLLGVLGLWAGDARASRLVVCLRFSWRSPLAAGRQIARSGDGFLFFSGFHPGRVAPKPFQVVTLPHVRAHDMDDDVKKIQHEPGGGQLSIDGARTHAVVVAQPVDDLLRNGAQVRLARAGGDHEVISNGGNRLHIQHDQVVRFLVIRQFTANQRQLLRFHRHQACRGRPQR